MGCALGLVAHFRPAQNDGDVRPHAFEGRDDFGRGRDVPDVNAQPDDLRIPRQQRFRDVHRPLVDVELHDGSVRPQRAEVGQQVAQPERGVDVLRVERGQDDISHRDGQLTSVRNARQWSSGRMLAKPPTWPPLELART